VTVYYVETSALIKRYVPESGSRTLDEIIDGRLAADLFTTPHLTHVEVDADIARLLKGTAITARDATDMLATFESDLVGTRFIVMPVDNHLLNEASKVARQFALRALDAIHVAAIFRVQREVGTNLCVVTSDRDILEVCATERIQALDPADPAHMSLLTRLRLGR
jgi:uncharacterized protein